MVGAAGIPETSTAVANNGNGKEKKQQNSMSTPPYQ